MKGIRVGARRACATAALGLGLIVGCGDDGGVSDVVETRTRPDAHFDTYATYAIVAKGDIPDFPDPPDVPEDIPEDVQLGLKETEKAVREQLDMRGLEEVDVDEDPDLYVLDFAATDEDGGIYWECVPGYTWWGWYTYWDPCAWLVPVPVSYEVGSIVVLLADPDIEEDDDYGQFVFGGIGQGILNGSNTDERIDDAVAEMFEDFPVVDDDD